MSILIGPNGAGKSNAVEAVQLLSAIAQGTKLHRITELGREGACEVRGGLQSCPSYEESTFVLGFTAHLPFERKLVPCAYWVGVSITPEPRIAAESLYLAGDTLLFETVRDASQRASADVKVRYNNFAQGGRKPKAAVSATQSVLSQYEGFIRTNRKRSASIRFVDAIRRHLRTSVVFDPRPSTMRSYDRVGNEVLQKDGSNISSVLFGLKRGDEEEVRTLTRIFNRIKAIPDEPCRGFGFVTTELHDVMFGLYEEASGALADARVLSAGTLRALAVLTALETAERGGQVIVEEFDNGLHPSRVKGLVDAIEETAERRGLHVLATTHNPATLNALSDSQLPGVVLVVREAAEFSSRMIPLIELPAHEELLERGRLGDLVTSRVLDQYLEPGLADVRRDQMSAWLESLQQ